MYASYEDGSGKILKSQSFTFKVPGTIEEVGQEIIEKEKLLIRQAYIYIDNNIWTKDGLNVYITADSPPSAQYIPYPRDAVEHWSRVLKARSGNDEAWNFNVFTST